MEALVRKVPIWMDLPENADYISERLASDSDFQDIYNAREQVGDYIEVRPDGYWSAPSGFKYPEDHFILVCAPGVDLTDKAAPVYAGEKLVRKRSNSIDISKLSLTKNKATISEAQLATIDKVNEAVIG